MPFYGAADWAYNLVMGCMPDAVRERSESSAFIMGASGIFGVARGLQWVSSNFMDSIISGFHEKWLPKLETACAVAVTAGPVLYGIMDPEGAREVITKHPTYTAGMAGVAVGGLAAAGRDIYNVADSLASAVRKEFRRLSGPTLINGEPVDLDE